LAKANLGQEYGMIIDGKDVFADDKFDDRTPIDTGMVLAVMQKGGPQHAQQALAAARKAFPVWAGMPWQERVRLVNRAADLIEERIFELGAAMALEVGKNRMESLGDVAESADLVRYSCYQMEKNGGYIVEMGKDPLVGYTATNISVLRPYGVWLVISPFNSRQLNRWRLGRAVSKTVVIKPATDTLDRSPAAVFRDAGLPDG
jgi:1-pyrroline-5-carboxylate dehydrogenase